MAINIFGFELGKRRTPKTVTDLEDREQPVKSFIPPDLEDGASVVDFVGGYGFGVQLINYDIAYRSDAELILRYRQMHEHAEVQTAVDDIVNQAIVLNERAEPISINMDKSKLSSSMKKKVKLEFDEILRLLQFNIRGTELFRKWYIDGRLYVQILMDEKKQRKGIAELRIVDPTKIKKVRNIEREVSSSGIKFIKSIKEYYLYTAEDYIGNGRDTINYTYSNDGIIIPSDSVAYVGSGFVDQSTKKVLGYLHKAIKPLNQLRMLEDSIVIYRISRAPERRIFYIDVGSLPKNKSEQYLRDIMNRYRNKLVYDTATGELRDEKRHMSMLEDFWMPRREGGKGTEVQTLPGGQNLGELQDVDYFLKKLYTSLHVPASRFREDSGFNMGKSAEISRDEVRFTKFVNRLQSKFCEMFLQLLRVQLLAKNIMTEEEWKDYSYDFSFDFAKDAYFAELKENEMTMTRLMTMREIEPYIGRFFSKNWIKKNILNFSDDDIDAMEEEMDQEAKDAPPQDMGMGMMGGMGMPMPPMGNEPPPTEDVGVEGIQSELGLSSDENELEVPEIEPYEGNPEETEGATGSTGANSGATQEDIQDMIDYYEDFFNKKSEATVLMESNIQNKSKTSYSPFSSNILKETLQKIVENQISLHK